jgi:hypothetical protein
MKLSTPWMLLPVAIVAGFLVGKLGGGKLEKDAAQPTKSTRESRDVRPVRGDPFGGPGFSLSSMDEIRALFRQQGGSVASARITLGVKDLSAAEIPALMEMVQQDSRDNPNDYEGRYVLMAALFERWSLVDPAAAIAFIHSCKLKSFQKMAAGSCFSAMGKVDPDRALLEFEKLPKGELREAASAQLMSAIADKDPKIACDLLEKESNPGFMSEYYAGEIFAKWAKTDPVAAAARLTAMPPDRVGDRCASKLAASWAQKDPEAALKWAKTLKGDWKNGAATEVYKFLSRQDPAAAWEKLKGEPGHLRGKLIGGVLETVADEDQKKAMSMLMSIGSKSEQRIATGQFLRQLNWNDSRLAFEVIDQLKDPATRRENIGNQIFYAAWNSPDLLKEQVAKMSDREKIDTSNQVLRGLISSDPKAAERYFLELPEAQRGTRGLNDMMSQYSNIDPKKAFDFAVSLTNPQEQTAAVNGLFNNWSREDPEAAAAGWKRLPAGQNRLEALDSVARQWGQSDPIEAKKWADGLSGVEKVRALAAVLPALARDNPSTASRQLAALIASPPDGTAKNLADSARNLAGQWASDEPTVAASWAAALPAGNARDEGLKAVSASWSQYDAAATAQWLGTLEAGSSRDAAIQPLVAQVRQSDPNTAFSWAASISDKNNRINELRSTIKSWRNSDLKAARYAFDAANLSTDERETLEKELD